MIETFFYLKMSKHLMYDLKGEENETPLKTYKNLEKPNQTKPNPILIINILRKNNLMPILFHLWSQRILALDGTGKEGSLRLLSL